MPDGTLLCLNGHVTSTCYMVDLLNEVNIVLFCYNLCFYFIDLHLGPGYSKATCCSVDDG